MRTRCKTQRPQSITGLRTKAEDEDYTTISVEPWVENSGKHNFERARYADMIARLRGVDLSEQYYKASTDVAVGLDGSDMSGTYEDPTFNESEPDEDYHHKLFEYGEESGSGDDEDDDEQEDEEDNIELVDDEEDSEDEGDEENDE